MASHIIDTASLGRSTDAQLSSHFFTLLPAEVRNLIYVEFWKLCSTRQHIVLKRVDDQDPENSCVVEEWSHAPCIADPRAEDTRFDRFGDSDPASPERTLWGLRLKSEWCLHWPCEEQHSKTWRLAKKLHSQISRSRGEGSESLDEDRETACQPLPKAGYFNILTACKRMYLECLPSLYANTTFIFTDTRTAGDFLTRYGGDPDRYPIRSLELSIRVPNIITEIYFPPAISNGDEGPPAIFAGRARPTLSMQNNPWQHLCDRLVALPNLQDLHIWFDSSDLRPWHKRVSETRFFGRLFDVRVPDKSRFVLDLPELPERRGPDSQALQGHYLEGEKLENAPFTLRRGPRPNNWRVHLRSIVNAGAVAQAISGVNVSGP